METTWDWRCKVHVSYVEKGQSSIVMYSVLSEMKHLILLECMLIRLFTLFAVSHAAAHFKQFK